MRSRHATVSHQPEVHSAVSNSRSAPSPIEEWLWADVFEAAWPDQPVEQLRNTLLSGD